MTARCFGGSMLARELAVAASQVSYTDRCAKRRRRRDGKFAWKLTPLALTTGCMPGTYYLRADPRS
jgi:hypothetical protein